VDLFDDRVAAVGLVRSRGVQAAVSEERVESLEQAVWPMASTANRPNQHVFEKRSRVMRVT